jgi:hypothetical protein
LGTIFGAVDMAATFFAAYGYFSGVWMAEFD